jgi:hypothetical protein
MTSSLSLKLATGDFLTQFSGARDLPPDTWYFIAAVVLSSLNRPGEIADVLQFAIAENEDEEQCRIARRIREALIKSAPVVGLPKVSPFSLTGPNDMSDRLLGLLATD